jgi:hypothetical protein
MSHWGQCMLSKCIAIKTPYKCHVGQQSASYANNTFIVHFMFAERSLIIHRQKLSKKIIIDQYPCIRSAMVFCCSKPPQCTPKSDNVRAYATT